jgi:hypothetical protein
MNVPAPEYRYHTLVVKVENRSGVLVPVLGRRDVHRG